MREIPVSRITDAVERLCIEANTHLPDDVKRAIEACRACEDGEIAVGVLDNIIENYQIADRECVPICQDTGMACVFLEIGQDVHLTGGDLREAVDEGVRRGYTNGFLRKSVVRDPVRRGNTGDNTPADSTRLYSFSFLKKSPRMLNSDSWLDIKFAKSCLFCTNSFVYPPPCLFTMLSHRSRGHTQGGSWKFRSPNWIGYGQME